MKRKGKQQPPPHAFGVGEYHGNAKRRVAVGGAVKRRHGGAVRWMVKVADRPYGFDTNWVPRARVVWEANFGPIPAGCGVFHRNLDRLDDRPENLVAMRPADWVRHLEQTVPGLKEKRTERSKASKREVGAVRRFVRVSRALRERPVRADNWTAGESKARQNIAAFLASLDGEERAA